MAIEIMKKEWRNNGNVEKSGDTPPSIVIIDSSKEVVCRLVFDLDENLIVYLHADYDWAGIFGRSKEEEEKCHH